MRILSGIDSLSELAGPLVLAIGVFDGVHPGHKAVIDAALQQAAAVGGTAVLVTFEPHPAKILRPDEAPQLIALPAYRDQLLARSGIPVLLTIPFTETFRKESPEAFITAICSRCDLAGICVGRDWTFGHARRGNFRLLEKMSADLGFSAKGIRSVVVAGRVVRSTAIRNAVFAGDLALASTLLGRPWAYYGKAHRGRQIARVLGFPTVNIRPESEVFPPYGVYSVSAVLDRGIVSGIANLGVRPTVDTVTEGTTPDAPWLEVHFFTDPGESYDRWFEVQLHRFIRREQHFGTLAALKEQIEQDVATAKAQKPFDFVQPETA
jgi:riboflavin kinase/FMN adenylyltransferase